MPKFYVIQYPPDSDYQEDVWIVYPTFEVNMSIPNPQDNPHIRLESLEEEQYWGIENPGSDFGHLYYHPCVTHNHIL